MTQIALICIVVGMFGCSTSENADSDAPQSSAQRAASVSALNDALKAETTLPHGRVLEKLDASTYTYLRLETASGELWVAVPHADVEIGAEVAIENSSRMDGFESKTLGRRFDKLLFGTLAGASAHGAGSPGAGTQPPQPQPEPAQTESIAVDKASGPDGRTVAELYAERQALAGKTVTVRAQVVKFSPEIMGTNWLHLRDGSGNETDGDNDLTVTTSATVKVGDVVEVHGTISVDRDFGAGYAYPLIIEDASVHIAGDTHT